MISLNYTLTSYSNFVKELAQILHTDVKDDVLIIPDEYGQGYFRALKFDDINALLYDFSLNDNFFLKRTKNNEEEFYTLIFEEISVPNNFKISIAQQQAGEDRKRPYVLYLTSFLYDVELLLHKETKIKGLRVFLSISWMKKYLQLNEMEDVLEKYINLKTENIWRKPVGAESKQLLQDLLEDKNKSLLHYQSKILRVVEIFFNWLYNEAKNTNLKPGISRSDITAAQRIESILTGENVVIPPTIKELAREAAMSESKLKKVFKTVYGLPIYEYFQKHRMQKARLMLLSGNYSIKDVGYSLGYSNLSNFTLAFKKEFGQLPSEVVKKD